MRVCVSVTVFGQFIAHSKTHQNYTRNEIDRTEIMKLAVFFEEKSVKVSLARVKPKKSMIIQDGQ